MSYGTMIQLVAMLLCFVPLSIQNTIPQWSYKSHPIARRATEFTVHNITVFSGDAMAAENLAVRSNGQILVTFSTPSPAQLWQIDPLQIIPPILVAEFPGISSGGIQELAKDMFYVGVKNASLYTPPLTGPGEIFEVNMNPFVGLPDGTIRTPAKVKSVAFLHEAKFINGMTTVLHQDCFVLVSDSDAGIVWKADVQTGAVSIAVQDDTMKAAANSTGVASIGLNGIRVFKNTLYYVNSALSTVHKIKIHATGTRAGKPVLVMDDISGDDLILDNSGVIYLASPEDVIYRIPKKGNATIVAGILDSNSSPLIGVTALKFGRLDSDRTSLYATANGHNQVAGAQGLFRVDIGDLAQLD